MEYKFKNETITNLTKERVLEALNVLILFARVNDEDGLEDELLEIEDKVKTS